MPQHARNVGGKYPEGGLLGRLQQQQQQARETGGGRKPRPDMRPSWICKQRICQEKNPPTETWCVFCGTHRNSPSTNDQRSGVRPAARRPGGRSRPPAQSPAARAVEVPAAGGGGRTWAGGGGGRQDNRPEYRNRARLQRAAELPGQQRLSWADRVRRGPEAPKYEDTRQWRAKQRVQEEPAGEEDDTFGVAELFTPPDDGR